MSIPEIEIRFEQLYLSQSFVNDHIYRKGISDSEIKVNPVLFIRRKLKERVSQSLEILSPVIRGNRTFNIIVHVHAQQSEDTISICAYFDPSRTALDEGEKFHFGIYLSELIKYVDTAVTEKKGVDPGPDLVWIHELIHMLDYANLSRQIKLMKQSDNRQPDIFLSDLNNQAMDSFPRHWQLLRLFADLRNEGTAQLFEKLTATSKEKIANRQHAVMIFRGFFVPLISHLQNTNVTRDSLSDYSGIRRNFKSVTYQIGHWFVLMTLANCRDETLSAAAAKALEFLERKKENFPMEDTLALIGFALEMDLGSSLYNTIRVTTDKNRLRFLEIDDLLGVAALITKKAYHNDYRAGFLRKTLHYALSRDPGGFIDNLREITGTPMSAEELEEEYNSFSRKYAHPGYSLEKEIKRKVDHLWEKWKKSGDPVLQDVLTYFFDPEDLVDDNLGYFGLLDDLYVLDAFEMLTKD